MHESLRFVDGVELTAAEAQSPQRDFILHIDSNDFT